MDPLLRELRDEREIRAAILRYTRAANRLDLEAMKSVYHPEAIDNHAEWHDLGTSFAEQIIKMLPQKYAGTMHYVTNCAIELHGDEADVETYLLGRHWFTEDGEDRALWLGGRYIDRFERRDEQWRIAARTFVRDWSTVETVCRVWDDRAFEPGRAAPDDLVYKHARQRE